MRPLEILLIATLLPPILAALGPQQRPKWLHLFPAVSLAILPLHLMIEGMRWQMWPAYLLTASLAAICLPALLFTQRAVTARRGWALTGAMIGLFVWLIALFIPIALPVPQLAETTGSYKVGTTIRHLVDEQRQETYTEDPNDNRQLTVQFWYPMTDIEGAERAIYLPALDVIGPVVAEQFGLPSFLLNHINLTKLDIFEDAPVAQAEAPFPIIIFSHGLGGLRIQNTVMFQELASQGYIVGAIDHAYANAISIFPEGRAVLYDRSLVFPTDEPDHVQANALLRIWAADIAFLLDEMAMWHEEGGSFNGRFHTQSVGVFGHSTGGGAAVEFCLRDVRCAAGVGLDSWVLPVSSTLLADGLSQPFMFISTPAWLGPQNRRRGLDIYNHLANDGYRLTLANTGHYDFTDLVLLSPLTPQLGLSGKINSQYSLRIQNEYILAFFDQYLRGIEESDRLQRPSPYPELNFEKR